jgi:hypothetical protein
MARDNWVSGLCPSSDIRWKKSKSSAIPREVHHSQNPLQWTKIYEFPLEVIVLTLCNTSVNSRHQKPRFTRFYIAKHLTQLWGGRRTEVNAVRMSLRTHCSETLQSTSWGHGEPAVFWSCQNVDPLGPQLENFKYNCMTHAGSLVGGLNKHAVWLQPTVLCAA